MRRKLFATLACALLLLSSTLNVSAAPSALPISKSNSYDYSKTGGGQYEYVVPFTANYDITLAGSQGASYGASGGGRGYVLTKQLRLQYNDIVKIELNDRPNYSLDTSTGKLSIPGGQPSKLYINDTLVWTAAGGAGQIDSNIVPTGCTSVIVQGGTGTAAGGWSSSVPVHWHSCSTKSGATHVTEPWNTVYSTTFLGGCYGWAGHTHNMTGTCPYHYTTHQHNGSCPTREPGHDLHVTNYSGASGYTSCSYCGQGHYGWDFPNGGFDEWAGGACPANDGWGCSGQPLNAGEVYDCGFYNNTQTIQCGYSNGQAFGYNNASYTAGTCYYNTSYSYRERVVDKLWDGTDDGVIYKEVTQSVNTTPSASLTNTGSGSFRIRLAEQSTLFYQNVAAANTYWLGGLVDLAILDNTVCFFKRR